MAKKNPIVWDAGRSPAANASRNLPALATVYFAEARTLLDTTQDVADLHRLRLLSKQLRYTLELFRPCYGPGLEERIGYLKRLQDLLGETNDAVASARLIQKMTGSIRMRSYLERRAAQKAAEFRTEWHTRFDAPGREAWWIGYLGRAGRTARSRALIFK
ncbi:MAG TPA: CHAD domain-containing protein [Candidatus Acidoferrales bacterium]|nr:CHAD domain-containing protein [Candidatus Acidoferrales bacterium]